MATLAPSLVGPPSSSKSLRPLPAGTRPRPNPIQFPFRELLRLPVRLLYSPTLSAEAAAEELGSARRTTLRDVTLADVLAGKYLSPLSLKDFEVSSVASDSRCLDLARRARLAPRGLSGSVYDLWLRPQSH